MDDVAKAAGVSKITVSNVVNGRNRVGAPTRLRVLQAIDELGYEVNLAARIEAAADPGGILISHPTYALVRDIVRAEERGSITAKGIRREVRVFAVAGIRDDPDPAPAARA